MLSSLRSAGSSDASHSALLVTFIDVLALCLAAYVVYRRFRQNRRWEYWIDVALLAAIPGALALYRQFGFSPLYDGNAQVELNLNVDGAATPGGGFNSALTTRLRPGGSTLTVDGAKISNLQVKAIDVACTSEVSWAPSTSWPTYTSVIIKNIDVSNLKQGATGEHLDALFIQGSTNPNVSPDILIQNANLHDLEGGVMPILIQAGGHASRITLDHVTWDNNQHAIEIKNIDCPLLVIKNSPTIRINVDADQDHLGRVVVVRDSADPTDPSAFGHPGTTPILFQDKDPADDPIDPGNDNRQSILGPSLSPPILIIFCSLLGAVLLYLAYRQRKSPTHLYPLVPLFILIGVVLTRGLAGDHLNDHLCKSLLGVQRWDVLEIFFLMLGIGLAWGPYGRPSRTKYQSFEKKVYVR